MAAVAVRGWFKARRERPFDYGAVFGRLQLKLELMDELIADFVAIQKARNVEDRLRGGDKRARVVAILRVEGHVGVLLNIGAEHGLAVGTPLAVLLTESIDGHPVERPLCVVSVTLVQGDGKCAQAQVTSRADEVYWKSVEAKLRQERVTPPSNIVVPYVPVGLEELSTASVATLIRHLQKVRESLARGRR